MVLVFFTSYHGKKKLRKVSRKYLKQFQVTEQTIITDITIFNVQKGLNSKSRLSRSTVRLFYTWSHNALHFVLVLSKYLKRFPRYKPDRVHAGNGYFQSLFCSKGGSSKSRLPMCSAHPLMVLYICEKFHQNISNGFQLTERTQVHGRNGYVQCSKGNNSKRRQTRVTVEKFCSSSYQALNLCENPSKCLKKGFQLTRRTLVHNRNGVNIYDVQRAVTPEVG